MLTKKMVKNSLEAIWWKRMIKLDVFLLVLVFGVPFLLQFFEKGDISLSLTATFSSVASMFVLIVSCILLYFVYRYNVLFMNLKEYEIYEVNLNHPHIARSPRGSVYYTLYFTTVDNQHLSIDTRPMWSSFPFFCFDFEEYNNKKIKIAYNSDTERLIILGL